MKKFLDTAAKYIYQKHGKRLHECCIIFPNKRAGIFFTSYLQKYIQKTIISPDIITINEFITSLSDFENTDKLNLISNLYQVYKKISGKEDSFDDFYYWGEAILSDFDEIDKYMVNTEYLFENLADFKEIDFKFDFLDKKQREILKQFWGSLEKWGEFRYKEDFLKIWKILDQVYQSFRKRLQDKGIAYSGMIFRQVAENISKGIYPEFHSAHYYFVGLSALNKCEKSVLQYLKENQKADFFWDYDHFYLNDNKQEAGLFIREYLKKFPQPENFCMDYNQFSNKKNIKLVAVPSINGQAQVIPDILNKVKTNTSPEFDHTAIVLADESLLFPVLNVIPENVKDVNVTMGYPVKNSGLFGLLELIANLVKNSANRKNIYYQYVFDILNHQLLAGIDLEIINEFIHSTKKNNRIYLTASELNFTEIHKLIFHVPEKVEYTGEYFISILKELYHHVEEGLRDYVLSELIISTSQSIEKLSLTIEEITKIGIKVDFPVYFRLFFLYLNQSQVSYEGEPLSGLQIMGILETRCLDFDNVIILGFNEDLWPAIPKIPSFIPYSLRFAYNLPSYDELNALYAYNFYRLIQRAKFITATYNTVKEGLGSGELSRFGYQLYYDSDHKVNTEQFEYSYKHISLSHYNVKSSDKISKRLLSKFSKEKVLSPSAINRYLGCRYKFYLHDIIGLPEKEDIKEEIDGQVFGNIFHWVMEEILKHSVGNKITSELLITLYDNHRIEKIIKSTIWEKYYRYSKDKHIDFTLEGKDMLIFEYIKSYLKQLLIYEKSIAPFDIISLESYYSGVINIGVKSENYMVGIGGIIDRLDIVDNRLRVVDYKTGYVNRLNFKNLSDIFERHAKNPQKEIFQALIYSFILKKFYYPDHKINPAIYGLRKLYEQKFDPYIKYDGRSLDFEYLSDDFEDMLKVLISEIFSPDTEFNRTDHDDHCRICSYKNICHR